MLYKVLIVLYLYLLIIYLYLLITFLFHVTIRAHIGGTIREHNTNTHISNTPISINNMVNIYNHNSLSILLLNNSLANIHITFTLDSHSIICGIIGNDSISNN